MSHKKWAVVTLAVLFIALFAFAFVTVVIDPFFQYHKPLTDLSYPLPNDMQRHISYGIVKNFDYQLLLTGTSLTHNFKTTDLEDVFGKKSVKVPLAGASDNELNNLIEKAIEHNPNLDTVVRSLDMHMYFDPYAMLTMVDHPEYLYDENFLNDVNYFLNKEVFFNHSLRVLDNTSQGKPSDTFDSYSAWSSDSEFNQELLLSTYKQNNIENPSEFVLTEQLRQTISYNFNNEILKLAKQNPHVTFIIFFPAYSSLWWNYSSQQYPISYLVDVEKYIISLLLTEPNIKTYYFKNATDITTDYNNYADATHYSPKIASLLTEHLAQDTYLLTNENYIEVLEQTEQFYLNYNYSTLLN